MHINFYNSTDDGTLIAVIVLAVTFAGMLMICTICEHYIISIPVLRTTSIEAISDSNAHYFVHRCLFMLLEATLQELQTIQ